MTPRISTSDTMASPVGYKVKQAGNAVTPPAARDLGYAVAEFLLAVAS